MVNSASGTLLDKQKKSYIESPARGVTETAQEVFVSNTGANPLPIEDTVSSNIKITNLSLTANVEGSYSFQTNSRRVMIRCRDNLDLKFAFIASESSTNYITLKVGCVLTLDGIDFSSKSIYLLTSSNCIVEILETYL